MFPKRGPAVLAQSLLLAGVAGAHLLPSSLTSPVSGGAYEAGSSVPISWTQSQAHAGTYRFEFSPDGGTTWVETGSMRAPSGDGKVVTYPWIVPAAPAAKARVRVCQPGGPCSDPDYFLESGDFAIRAASPVRPGRSHPGPGLRIHPGQGTLYVTLIVDRPGPIDLLAFDARGASALILSETLSRAGEHRRRLPFPAGLAGLAGLSGRRPAVLVLRAGEGVRAVPAPSLPPDF
jgi:hypothetical protein